MSNAIYFFVSLFSRKNQEVPLDPTKETCMMNYGLCNQLISVLTMIDMLLERKYPLAILYIDCFSCGMDTGNLFNIRNILDIPKTNEAINYYLKKKLGFENSTIELKERSEIGYTSNKIGEVWKNESGPYFNWYIFFTNPFDEVIHLLQWNENILKMIDEIYQDYEFNLPTNCIHVRIEEDGLLNWSKVNKLSVDDFRTYLSNKYRSLCNNYLTKGSRILLCCSLESENACNNKNNVNVNVNEKQKYIYHDQLNSHDFVVVNKESHLKMKEDESVLSFIYKNYQVIEIDKQKYLTKYQVPYGREICGLIDLLIASKLKDSTVIGCQNPLTKYGSSFSLFLRLLTCKENKKVMFDLDQIYVKEHVYY